MKKISGVKSDVWSLGCVLWETVSLGATLYPGVHAQDVMTRVMRGLRAPHPLGASDVLFQLMLNCWMLDPYERPVNDFLVLFKEAFKKKVERGLLHQPKEKNKAFKMQY